MLVLGLVVSLVVWGRGRVSLRQDACPVNNCPAHDADHGGFVGPASTEG